MIDIIKGVIKNLGILKDIMLIVATLVNTYKTLLEIKKLKRPDQKRFNKKKK